MGYLLSVATALGAASNEWSVQDLPRINEYLRLLQQGIIAGVNKKGLVNLFSNSD